VPRAKTNCLCGKPVYRGDKCATCYRHGERFEGHRGEVIARDEGVCVGCADKPDHPCVHHRQPGESEPPKLATVCTKCHAKIHRTRRQNRYMTPTQQELWAELHQPEALQLQLPEAFLLTGAAIPPLVEFTAPEPVAEPGPLQLPLDNRQTEFDYLDDVTHTRARAAGA
jgi:hypothetical protein